MALKAEGPEEMAADASRSRPCTSGGWGPDGTGVGPWGHTRSSRLPNIIDLDRAVTVRLAIIDSRQRSVRELHEPQGRGARTPANTCSQRQRSPPAPQS